MAATLQNVLTIIVEETAEVEAADTLELSAQYFANLFDRTEVLAFIKTPAELATQFLDLEIIPTNLYSLSLTGGNSADLAAAVDADGNAFSGLSGDGTWLLALRCGRCYNPAPVFLSVLVAE